MGLASSHSTRSEAMRTGPVSVTRTGRQMPPGFPAPSTWSPDWNTPVMLRLPWGSRLALHVTSTASACPDRPRRASVTSNAWGTK